MRMPPTTTCWPPACGLVDFIFLVPFKCPNPLGAIDKVCASTVSRLGVSGSPALMHERETQSRRSTPTLLVKQKHGKWSQKPSHTSSLSLSTCSKQIDCKDRCRLPTLTPCSTELNKDWSKIHRTKSLDGPKEFTEQRSDKKWLAKI
jgi:hypothetical protein